MNRHPTANGRATLRRQIRRDFTPPTTIHPVTERMDPMPDHTSLLSPLSPTCQHFAASCERALLLEQAKAAPDPRQESKEDVQRFRSRIRRRDRG
jgi:hypothetical protein